MFRRTHTQPLKVVTAPEDDWEEKTVNERMSPRVTLADLHGVVGRLAREVRILAIVVALSTLATVARVIW